MKNDYKSELNRKGIIGFVPGGNSMWPTLKDKSQSVVVKKKEGRLNKYDVGLYLRDDNTYVMHRVIEVLPDGYVFLGDSQITPEKVSEDKVIGVLLGFNRKKKFISVEDESYKKEIYKLFKNDKRRLKRVKRHFFILGVKSKIKRIFKKEKAND